MRQLQITPLDGYDPEIGRWLWALQDVRRRYTLRLVKDLDQRLVDWEGPDGQENAIGSLLYHIAHVEMGQLGIQCPLFSVVLDAERGRSWSQRRRTGYRTGAAHAARVLRDIDFVSTLQAKKPGRAESSTLCAAGLSSGGIEQK